MSDPHSWLEDPPGRPYFFLSYAHTPGFQQGGTDPDHWVHVLYQDLCQAILQRTDLRDHTSVGFIDRRMHIGDGWSDRLSTALKRCRVFVPLYSRRYFTSEACGKEWGAFASRKVFPIRPDAQHTSCIVPVLWSPVAEEELPGVASRLQFVHEDFGQQYAAEGTFALVKLGYLRNDYELAVHSLAKRIVEVAENTLIEQGAVGFPEAANVFNGARQRTRSLRISVLACDQESVPEGRGTETYGATELDWWPYRQRPASSASAGIGDHAAQLARNLDLDATVDTLSSAIDGMVGEGAPEAPGLLLLDRWALRDPRRRALAERFSRRNPPWVSLLEPWCREDPECQAADGDLRALADEVLRRNRRHRPNLRAAPAELGTPEDFRNELPQAAQRAIIAYGDTIKPPRPPAGPGPYRSRPSLRGPEERPPGPGGPPREGPRPDQDPGDPEDPESGGGA